jgi:hypothetical protein
LFGFQDVDHAGRSNDRHPGRVLGEIQVQFVINSESFAVLDRNGKGREMVGALQLGFASNLYPAILAIAQKSAQLPQPESN